MASNRNAPMCAFCDKRPRSKMAALCSDCLRRLVICLWRVDAERQEALQTQERLRSLLGSEAGPDAATSNGRC